MKKKTGMISLNDLIAKHQELTAEIIESGGELTAEIEEALAATDADVADKLDAYARYAGYLQGEEEYLKGTAKQYADRARTLANARERLRQRMAWAMEAVGETKIKTAEHNYSLRYTESWRVKEDVGDDVKQTLVTRGLGQYEFSPDMRAIRAMFAGSEATPEWAEVTVKQSITIR